MRAKTYTVHELFYTLQGEGARAGTAAVFCRFSGCNLWSGREIHRAQARCNFCDTVFVGTRTSGGKFTTPTALADAVAAHWPAQAQGERWVVCTGGEPLLQLDSPLLAAFHAQGFKVAVETNGTYAVPSGVDWLCVSPKAGVTLQQCAGDELKLIYPQPGLNPATLLELPFQHFFLQPMAGTDLEAHTAAAVYYCLEHPRWRLSLQTHKWLGIP